MVVCSGIMEMVTRLGVDEVDALLLDMAEVLDDELDMVMLALDD